MMTNKVSKQPLDFNLYSTYEIPQEYMAYELLIGDISAQESDDIEAEYSLKGYKIFHSEMSRSHNNLFNYKLIIAKMEMTF